MVQDSHRSPSGAVLIAHQQMVRAVARKAGLGCSEPDLSAYVSAAAEHRPAVVYRDAVEAAARAVTEGGELRIQRLP